MAYDGPLTGQLNVIPLAAGTYTPASPSIDVGNDGEFCLDLNTNILYGPKDGNNTGYPWPVASRLGQKLTWRGAFAIPAAYTPGDVVSRTGTYAGQYLCVKPVVVYPATVNATTSGSWQPGDYVYDSVFNYLYVCHSATTQTPSALGALAALAYWVGGYPEDDWNGQANAYAAQGNWVYLSAEVQVDSTVTVGNATTWVLGSASIGSSKLATDAVTTGKVADGAITTAKIADSGITTGKLATDAVTTAKILDVNVTDAKLSSTGVTAGTYSKVTVTSKGRITAGASLANGDIPCPLDLQPAANSTTAFRVRNAAATVDVLKVDTTNTEVLVAQSLKVQTILDGTTTSWIKSSDGTAVFNVDTTNKRTEVNSLNVTGGTSTFARGVNLAYRGISALRTLDSTDYVVNCTANTFTVTLPTAVGIPGRKYIIKNSGTGTITVATTSSQTIDGAATKSLATQYSVLTVMSNGANWIAL